mmetsp:Transcript_4312/g.9839  ORF Transcript_4312/g.9839 Transcript_4312/m.9839 type:complete len:212 (+) Transcript_4312:440-1075(+)
MDRWPRSTRRWISSPKTYSTNLTTHRSAQSFSSFVQSARRSWPPPCRLPHLHQRPHARMTPATGGPPPHHLPPVAPLTPTPLGRRQCSANALEKMLRWPSPRTRRLMAGPLHSQAPGTPRHSPGETTATGRQGRLMEVVLLVVGRWGAIANVLPLLLLLLIATPDVGVMAVRGRGGAGTGTRTSMTTMTIWQTSSSTDTRRMLIGRSSCGV